MAYGIHQLFGDKFDSTSKNYVFQTNQSKRVFYGNITMFVYYI